MGQYKYISNRTLQNGKGKESGRIRIMVKADSDNAEGDYVCPECSSSGKVSQAWRRPFNVKCGSCGFLMRLPKLLTKKKEKVAV